MHGRNTKADNCMGEIQKQTLEVYCSKSLLITGNLSHWTA